MAPQNILYISKVGRDAWLRVKLDTGGEVSLPQHLKVRLIETKQNRDFFEILEGPEKGKRANVSRPSTAQSYLIPGRGPLPGGIVKFDRDKQRLWFGTEGPFNAFSGAFATYTVVEKGTYKLAIPDAPHSATREAYYKYTQFHKTWFRIGTSTSGSRYLHVGEISEGCVTVRAFVFDPTKMAPEGFSDLPQLARDTPGAIGMPYPHSAEMAPLASWDKLYEYLINRRADDLSVGTLTVI